MMDCPMRQTVFILLHTGSGERSHETARRVDLEGAWVVSHSDPILHGATRRRRTRERAAVLGLTMAVFSFCS